MKLRIGLAIAIASGLLGCSIDDLVPCNGLPGKRWADHGAYLKAYIAAANQFLADHLIDPQTKDDLVSSAAQSTCGAKR